MTPTTHLRCVTALALVAGCQGAEPFHVRAEQEARATLSRTFSCPTDRVAVKARPDLRPFDLLVGKSSPPPDVAADPGRLAVWTEGQRELEKGYARHEVIETTGCDQRIFYVCTLGDAGNQGVVVACQMPAYPPAR